MFRGRKFRWTDRDRAHPAVLVAFDGDCRSPRERRELRKPVVGKRDTVTTAHDRREHFLVNADPCFCRGVAWPFYNRDRTASPFSVREREIGDGAAMAGQRSIERRKLAGAVKDYP